MKKSKQSIQWNKVTPLSKYLTMILFALLPFIGFILGLKYQQSNIKPNSQKPSSNSITKQLNTSINQNREIPTASPRETIGNILSKKYTTKSGRVSFSYYPGWVIKNYDINYYDNNSNKIESGITTSIQGPKQVLRIIEGVPDHAFDDFEIVKYQVNINGKLYEAEKYTSQSWKNSFISLKIQDNPYKLYVEYGDAASVGFQGFNQEYKEIVNFEKDIQPIDNLLQTLTW